MSSNIVGIQRKILRNLVDAGKITQQQADTQPASEAMEQVVPDILRVCKDDEAVAHAIAKALERDVFKEVEEGLTIIHGQDGEPWFIYGNTIFIANPFHRRMVEKATGFARSNNIPHPKVGVVSHSRLESIKAIDGDDDDSSVQDSEQLKARAIQRVEDLVREAAKLNASDIHLQPTQGDQIQVRFRIDGELLARKRYSTVIHEAILRVVIEGNCGLTMELNKPQDGKFSFSLSSHKTINLRVSTLPVSRGSEATPKCVIRLLGNDSSLSDLNKLGMSKSNLDLIRRLADSPNGLIIVTGPTGSGKTTTLNATLLDIYGQDPNRNYHTIEEPVEMQHEGMSHTECGEHLSFAAALRALLRQDPDVILLGEMRDNETAEYAFKAGQTGHLVLTTLHTNNSHESLDRLARMDIPADIIVSNTRAIMAQRLVRSLCKSCRVEYLFRSDEERFLQYGSNPAFNGNGDLKLYKANPKGCQSCNSGGLQFSGLKGRRGVIEILEITPEIQEAVLDGMTTSQLRRSQLAEGSFKDLWDDGLRLVAEGVVGFEQLEKELGPYLSHRMSGKADRLQRPVGFKVPPKSPTSLVAQL
ncbi:TPA: GspE/PulE family protein [Pseudomonas aeruginosa]